MLIYFLDSDEEFEIKVLKGDGREDEVRFINYFYWIDRIFRTVDVKVLTGKVVGDPPVSPSVMANTFLDDLGSFLAAVSGVGADAPCPFHETRQPGEFSAEYHDMAKLFGYSRAEALRRYHCTLAGEHTARDCFSEFSEKALDFLYGLHPTRAQYYRHLGEITRTEAARTVYTGNYVFTPDALEYFIPFAGLNLRMAGPTLGRLLRAELGEKFVSANAPLLHRRTSGGRKREFRSGVTAGKGAADLSEEFVRQFWGDVMLFSIEALTAKGFPEEVLPSAEVETVVRDVQERLWNLYRTKKTAAAEKIRAVKKYLSEGGSWWNNRDDATEAVRNFQGLCTAMEDNFGDNSAALQKLSGMIDEGSFSKVLTTAIIAFDEDRRLWCRLLRSIGNDRGRPDIL